MKANRPKFQMGRVKEHMTALSPFLSLPSSRLFRPGLGLIPNSRPVYSTFVQLTLTDFVVRSALGHVSSNHLSASGVLQMGPEDRGSI